MEIKIIMGNDPKTAKPINSHTHKVAELEKLARLLEKDDTSATDIELIANALGQRRKPLK